jgi:hypothetical protein
MFQEETVESTLDPDPLYISEDTAGDRECFLHHVHTELEATNLAVRDAKSFKVSCRQQFDGIKLSNIPRTSNHPLLGFEPADTIFANLEAPTQ